MKAVLWILFLISIILTIMGFSKLSNGLEQGHQYIGSGVVTFFAGWMPLFIYNRYKGKDLKKYMINDKTIKNIKKEAENFLE